MAISSTLLILSGIRFQLVYKDSDRSSGSGL